MMRVRKLISTGLAMLGALIGQLIILSPTALAGTEYTFRSFKASSNAGVSESFRPSGVGVNTGGDVYVNDREHSAIDKFAATDPFDSTAEVFQARAIVPGGESSWELAVDNSANLLDTAKGDVYVAEGEAGIVVRCNQELEGCIELLTGLAEPRGVAVDSQGNLYVALFEGAINKFDFNGEPDPGNPILTVSEGAGVREIAVDANGHIFVATEQGVIEYQPSGECVNSCTPIQTGYTTGVAVNPAGDVFVDNGSEISKYDPTGTFIDQFGSRNIYIGEGLAVYGSRVYVADRVEEDIAVFESITVPAPPQVTVGPVTQLTPSGARLEGAVNPENAGGSEEEAYYCFEYGTSSNYSLGTLPHAGPTNAGQGTTPVPVSATLSGLFPETTYHYRLVAINRRRSNVPASACNLSFGQETASPDQVFTTTPAPTPPPIVTTARPTEVTPSSVTLSGIVDSQGLRTTYVFQLGMDTNYGTEVFGDAGADSELREVNTRVGNLQPGTTYHYRLLGKNRGGTTYSIDQTFTTPTIPGSVIAAPASTILLSPVTFTPPKPAGKTHPKGKHRKKKFANGPQNGRPKEGGRSTKRQAVV
jgi:hypothetical protein